MNKTMLKIVFLGAVALFAVQVQATSVVPSCNFSRDMGLDMGGEDVRCLQQYLKDTSFYRFGYADGYFGPMTRQSVMDWQMTYGLPPSGFFDAASRAKYFSMTGGGTMPCNYLGCGGGYYGTQEQKAMQRIKDAITMIEDAEDEIDDSRRNTRQAEEFLIDAGADLFDSIRAYFIDRDFVEAYDKADDAFVNAEEAFDEAGGSSSSGDRNDADDAIDDAREAINDARNEIVFAKSRGADVRDAEDTLGDAEESLQDAEDEFDDRNYDDAEDLAKEAEDLADEAIDDI